jgi:hypothetical protein
MMVGKLVKVELLNYNLFVDPEKTNPIVYGITIITITIIRGNYNLYIILLIVSTFFV